MTEATGYEEETKSEDAVDGKVEGKDGKPLLRAKTVYLYMGSESRVSRSSRIQWLLEHLDAVVTIPQVDSLERITKPIDIVSVVPEERGVVDWRPDTAHLYHYFIHPHTQLVFLSRRYCITYCLDMSPSLSTVDVQNGEVMMDKVLTCLKTSLEAVSKSFVVPGSKLVLHPQIYISIIANTPFFTTPAQQVLVQNWHVTGDNLADLLKNIQSELLKIENAVAEVSQIYMDQVELCRADMGNLVGDLFEEEAKKPPRLGVAMVNPDQGFINMLRFGMLALRLLPAASCASIVVVTDGVITLPDAYLLDATLNRLRSTGVCCSFLHVGSTFHPHVGTARVPYFDLMEFVASASLGVYMTNIPEATILDFRDLQINRFHRAFLSWCFHAMEPPTKSPDVQSSQWFLCNPSFCPGQEHQLLRKKQLEETLNVSLVKLLCCRIREGYVIQNIVLGEGQIEMKLVLMWKYQVHLEYTVRSKWPVSTSVHYSLVIKAPYEFLHDISCNKKPFHAAFRQAVVSRFWSTMKSFAQSDYLLVHLHSKESNPAWNAIPETIRSGMPLFYLSTGTSSPIISTNDVTYSQFSAFWKPICVLDPDLWHKWLHTYRIGLVLRHDYPLPKNLHLTNPSGRFQGIQCRHAATALQAMLRDSNSFVLVDNQSFVKLYPPDDELATGWFCIMRITCKPPCVVVNIAFPCGISSKTRWSIISKLKTSLCELSCTSKLPPQERRYADRATEGHQPVSRTSSRVSCCTVLQKPVEKILIRYERMPSTFDTVVFPDGTQPSLSGKSPVTESGRAGYLVTTLSRYLHHKRWIWEAQCTAGSSLGAPAIARVLSTITKMRLQEGFSFAHSQAGIVNMLLEVQMQVNPELGDEVSRCVLQYVLFPPYVKREEGRSQVEGDSDEEEREGTLQIVTESWVEPHSGLVAGSSTPRSYMDQLPYNKLSDAIANVDAQCISSLLTFEHLSLMARNKSVAPPADMSVITDTSKLKDRVIVYDDGHSLSDDRIHYVPFLFNLLNILPSCRQAELLFSIPVQDLPPNWQLPTSKEALNPDVKNASLMELIFDQLTKLHDRELRLTEEDSLNFVEHLHKRERDSDVYPIPIPKTGETSTTPAWRCYVKGISSVHVTLTFIPASYSDLKALMSNKVSSIESKSLKTLTIDDNSIGDFVDWNRKRQSCNSVDQMIPESLPHQSTPCHKEEGRSHWMKNVSKLGAFNDASNLEMPNYLQSSLDNLADSSGMLGDMTGSQVATLELSDLSLQRMFNAMSKPYRVRASSLDTNFDRNRRRTLTGASLRTTSMEAKIWGNRSSAVSDTSGVTRSNTQASEISTEHIDKSSNADATSEDLMPSADAEHHELQDPSKVFNTIPLPIFIYDCPLNHLIDTIVYKDNRLLPTE